MLHTTGDPPATDSASENNPVSSSSNARPPGPATARGQRTRKKLLDAAEHVFGTAGYERASIVEITRTAGVAQGTFYVYFPSKKEVFVELVWELNRRLRRCLRDASTALIDPDRYDLERTGAITFLQFVVDHRNLYRIVRQAEFVDEKLFQEYYRQLSAGYRAGLEESMERGEIRRFDPEALVYMLMGILDFVGMRWVLWEGQMPSERVLDDMLGLIRDGLRMKTQAELEAAGDS